MPPPPPRSVFLPCLLSCVALAAFYQPLPPALEENIRNIPQGLFFGYGLAPVLQHPSNLSMPLSPVLNFLIYLLPPGTEAYVWPVFYLCTGMLAFALAAELTASAWAGAVAAAFAALALSLRVPRMLCTPEQMIYAVACSVAAYVLMRRAINPRSAKTELVAGAAIGLTLFIKSPLFLLPFALAAWDILSGRLKRGETNWKLLAILCLVPYAMLLPWTWMHYSLSHTLLLLEGNRANQNMITGALGIVFTLEGAYPLANHLPANGSVLLWAVKTVATHPLTFAGGVLRRLYSLFVWYPLAAAGLAASALRFRNDRRFQALLFLLGYYVSIHSLLSIQERYFIPVWTIGLAGAVALFFPPRTLPQTTQSAKLAKDIAAAFFALLAALYLFTAALLVSYPYRAKANGHKLQSPQHASAPILALMAEQALSEGDMSTAETYARTALLSRQSNLERCAYFYVLIAKGIDISRPMKNFPLRMDTPHDRREASYLRLANALRQERDIAGELRQAFLDWRFASASFRKITSLEESQWQKMQRAETSAFSEWELPGLVSRFPSQLHLKLVEKLRQHDIRPIRLTQLLLNDMLKEPLAMDTRKHSSCRRPSEFAGDTLRDAEFYNTIKRYLEMRPLSPQDLECLYNELLSHGMDNSLLKEFALTILRKPESRQHFLKIERLHETKQYAALIKPAEEYLRDYPYDQVATLFLAVAYLNTGNLKQAKNCLDRAAALPLEPQEKQWLNALRANYGKEVAVKGE